MNKTILLVCVTLGLSIAAHSVAAPGAPIYDKKSYTIAHKKFVLSNGLTLIVHEDHSVPVVGVNIWYHVGSRNEQRGKTGFAHLFEHFFFNGSENHPHGFREAMDDLGANNRNGTTSYDRTNFYEDVPVSALERTLFLESDRMGYLGNTISGPMLERERGVVQNEKRELENRPYGRVSSEFNGKMYPYSHPYAWSPVGSTEDLNAATLDDVKAWYRTYYGPNNAVISLAGDITPERALELVNRFFGAIPPGPPLPRATQWTPRLESSVSDQIEDRAPQARIYRSWHAPAWKDGAWRRLGLLGDILAGSNGARLTRRLVFDKGLATGVFAGVREQELSSIFTIVATVKQGIDPVLVEREIDLVLGELLDKGVTEAELQRVKTARLANYARRIAPLGGRAEMLSESMTLGGAPDAYAAQIDAMLAATPAQVTATGVTWLRAHHYTMRVKPFGKLAADKPAYDRKLLPPLGAAPDLALPTVQRAQLKNGLKVMLMERHAVPLVNLTLALDAGAASDSVATAGAASLALDLLDKGTRRRTAFQFADALDAVGARFTTSSSADQSLAALESTSANLKASVALMADAVLNATFPDDQFTLQKQRQLAQIAQARATPSALGLQVMRELLYGPTHAYGRSVHGTEASVNRLTRDDLDKWHGAWFKPGSATLIVSGDTSMAQLLPMLEASFGRWQAGVAPPKTVPVVPAPAGKKLFLIDRPGAPQSTIVAAHLSQLQGQPEDLAIELAMENFGGIATSRLNRNLRLDKHWSYGTRGMLTSVRGQRAFMTLAPVQSDKTREAMLEVAREIFGLAGARPLAGNEFSSIMRNVTSGLGGRFETLGSLDQAAVASVNLGLPDNYWQQYQASIKGLDEAQVAAAGKKFVRPDELVWLVVGDLAKIEAGVRALNWGEVVILSAEGKAAR